MGAPYWNQNAKAAIYGIGINSGINEIVKATIQSIAFQTKDLIKIMEKDISSKITEIRVDGGMTNNESFLQFLSDILNIKIIKQKNSEITALGAAYLSGIGSKLTTFKKIKSKFNKKKNFKPKINKMERNKLYEGWIKAVEKTLI